MTTAPRRDGRRAVGLIMIGTGALGVSGLVILALTARTLGAADYATFGVFWSALFFVVAVLSGVQQESTRAVAVQRRAGTSGSTSLVALAAVVAAIATVVLVGTSPWWGHAVFGDDHHSLMPVLAAGAVGYVFTGVLAGVCAGSERWSTYGAMLVVEAVARAVGVVGVLLVSSSSAALAWTVVAAYPVVLVTVGVPVLRRVRSEMRVDESMTALLQKAAKTLGATVSVAAMVNGFPLLLSVFDRGASSEVLGSMTLAVILTRAPLLLPLMALQSYLITVFARPAGALWRTLLTLLAGCFAVVGVLAIPAAVIGPPILRDLFGPDFVVGGRSLALLVLSSGGLGALCMSSAALLARNRHSDNLGGWWIAVLATVAVLAWSPGGLELRAPVALLIGPCLGLVCHVLGLVRDTRAPVAP